MTVLDEVLAWVQAWGWGSDTSWVAAAGVEALGKASLLLLCTWLVATALRRGPASLRAASWSVLLCGAVLLPLGSSLLPRWAVPLPDAGRLVAKAHLIDCCGQSPTGASLSPPVCFTLQILVLPQLSSIRYS